MNSKEISTDVLLIGGGPAAFLAAIKAREAGAQRVTVVCKAVAGSSGAGMYIVGNLRDWRPEEIKGLMPQMITEGLFMADQNWMEFLSTEHHKRMDELRKWGVKFVKVRGKEVRTGKGVFAGGEMNANVWVQGNGIGLLWPMRSQALKVGVNTRKREVILH